MTYEEYVTKDAVALAEHVAGGDVTPTELLELALARTELVNPILNAVVRSMEDDARAAAADPPAGPFAGVPYLAKDLLSNFAGHPTSGASRLLQDLIQDHDSELVRRIREAGLVVFGKTNLPEWGLVPYSESTLFGDCRNPWDTERTPGGSSGGSAAAIAAGVVPMAGGGDGGGSIRIPASCCGLFGLKPTRGRTPTGPDLGLIWRGAVVEHALTRSVRDSAVMLDATHGPDLGPPFEIPVPDGPYAAEVGRDPGRLRVGLMTRSLMDGDVHPDCVAAALDAAELLTELGHEVTEAAPDVDGTVFSQAFLTMVAGELAADLEYYRSLTGRKARRADVEPATWALGLLGDGLTAREYATALRTLESMGRSVGRFFESYDLLLTPTLAAPPPPVGSLAPTAAEQRAMSLVGRFGSGALVRRAGLLEQAAADAFSFIPWTPVFNATGNPAMSVPLFWNDRGLPIGVHLVARFGKEDTLFRVAGQLERARPWFHRLPEIPNRR